MRENAAVVMAPGSRLPLPTEAEVTQHVLVIAGGGTERDGAADLMVTDGALRRPRRCLLTGHKPETRTAVVPRLLLDSLQTPPSPSPDPDVDEELLRSKQQQ